MKTKNVSASLWVTLNFQKMEPRVLTGSVERKNGENVGSCTWLLFFFFVLWVFFYDSKAIPTELRLSEYSLFILYLR